jgi:general secretion pathway protein J
VVGGQIGSRSSPRALRGFTLVEVLVALFVMAVIAVLGWQGVAGMSRSREISQQVVERTLRMQTVVAQWEQDLAAVQDTGAAPALQFDGATLRLTRVADGGVQVVAWSLREGVWRRWVSPATTQVGELQQAWLRSQQLQGPETAQVRLFDGVTGWQVWFHRGGWSNAQSTGDLSANPAADAAAAAATAGSAAAAAPREKLPAGVRLMLDIGGERLTRDVALAPQAP